MRSHSYLNSAKRIIELYDGKIPLAAWLKEHFKANKKFGSKDRREVGHICYCYFRLGKAFGELELEERMLLALFLCSESSNFVLQELKPEWNEQVTLHLAEKLKSVHGVEKVTEIFPLAGFVSSQIDFAEFTASLLSQPSLFLRIRPGAEKKVVAALKNASIDFELEEDTIRLANGTKIEEVVAVDKDVVIQDLNSQKTLDHLKTSNDKLRTAWDCCAASGGKSILLHDLLPSVQLTVCDVRESILANLKKRFASAGINQYESFVADVSSAKFSLNQKFDLIICDAPCSGSGTWGRTPEQLCFFKKEKFDHYTSLQKKISVNAAQCLKRDGAFVYITCSVFSAENESIVEFIQSGTNLQLHEQRYLKGYDKKADTLFVAVFRNRE